MPRQPAGRSGGSKVFVSVVSAIWCLPSLAEQLATDVDETVCPARQKPEQNQPDQQQEMPIDGAEFHTQAHLDHLSATPHLGSRSSQRHQTTDQVQPVQRSDQVEEGIGWIGRQKIARGAQLLPRNELPNQECNGGWSTFRQAAHCTVDV